MVTTTIDPAEVVKDFLASGGDERYTYSGKLFDDCFDEEAIKLVMKHGATSDDLGNFSRLFISYANASLGEADEHDNISTTRAELERQAHIVLRAGLKAIFEAKELPAEDRIAAAELSERNK